VILIFLRSTFNAFAHSRCKLAMLACKIHAHFQSVFFQKFLRLRHIGHGRSILKLLMVKTMSLKIWREAKKKFLKKMEIFFDVEKP
jgi:hypothetical protein